MLSLKNFRTLALGLSLVAASPAFAKGGPFGLGIFLGEPIGITGKVNLDPVHSIDFISAWSFGRGNAFYLHADYLFHVRGIFKVEQAPFDLHFGGGAAITVASGGAGFGFRAPVGLGHTFRQVPIEVFVEVAIHLLLAPSTGAAATGGIGARYYF